ncbi:MAG: hypothetical protein HY842_05700, partial [Bacteroidetes bacterium]|nr:hypothetical protein [Bacteroidota bacterium]
YAVYKSILDNQVRYLYDDAVAPGTTETFAHSALPIISSPIAIDFPQGQIGYFGILGDPVGTEDKLLEVSSAFGFSGPSQHYVPSNIFEEFFTFTSGTLPSNASFSTATLSPTLATVFVVPNYDFDVIADSDGFTFSTTSDFDIFTTCYRNIAEEVSWCITAEQKPTVTFSFPTIPTAILDEFAALSATLDYSSTSGTKNEPAISFIEYLDSQFSGNTIDYERQDAIYKTP